MQINSYSILNLLFIITHIYSLYLPNNISSIENMYINYNFTIKQNYNYLLDNDYKIIIPKINKYVKYII